MLELTTENAAAYLRDRGWLEHGTAEVEPLGWGVSNAVFRVTTPTGCFVVKQSRPQLRTKELWVSNIDRIFREVAVMRVLGARLPQPTVPEIRFVDWDNYLFGMSHAPLDAVVWKESLLAGQTDQRVAHRAGMILGLIHESTAVEGEGEADCEKPEMGVPPVADLSDRLVFDQLRIEPFYRRIYARRPEVAEAIVSLVDQMLLSSEAVCHGDFSPKNLLVHQGGEGIFTLVDYETGHLGDPTMDLGFFLSHLILKAFKNHREHRAYFELTRRFWEGYGSMVRFRPLPELVARGIQHFGACAFARIDGTSPVDYLPEEPKREAVRNLCRSVLLDTPRTWQEVLDLVEEQMKALGGR